MTRFNVAVLLVGLLAWCGGTGIRATADDKLEPGDPIAAIDGDPIYLGELNLILTERLKARDLDKLGIQVQQATATLLVRRHLALKSLREQGGEMLEAMIRRQLEMYAAEVKRRGSSMEEQAKSKMADENSLAADIAWRTAWSQYLKSRLNDANLRSFFDQHPDRYAGTRWEVSQIFIKVDPRSAASVKATEASLSELADELRASGAVDEAFADAARQHSESGSAAQGGMVGWVENDGDLPASVMAAVRTTAVGQVSAPVRSPLGMHLLLVHQTEPGKLSFDDLTDVAQLRRDATDALFDALVARQRGAKVTWFVAALKPPPSVALFPE